MMVHRRRHFCRRFLHISCRTLLAKQMCFQDNYAIEKYPNYVQQYSTGTGAVHLELKLVTMGKQPLR